MPINLARWRLQGWARTLRTTGRCPFTNTSEGRLEFHSQEWEGRDSSPPWPRRSLKVIFSSCYFFRPGCLFQMVKRLVKECAGARTRRAFARRCDCWAPCFFRSLALLPCHSPSLAASLAEVSPQLCIAIVSAPSRSPIEGGGVRPALVFPLVLGACPQGFTRQELRQPTVNFRLARVPWHGTVVFHFGSTRRESLPAACVVAVLIGEWLSLRSYPLRRVRLLFFAFGMILLRAARGLQTVSCQRIFV